MKKILLLNILLVLLATSCESFLDVKPAGKLIPANGDVASFDKLLNNVNTIQWIYMNNNRGSSLPYLTDDLEMSDNQADYAWYNGHPNIDCYFAYTFKMPYGNPENQDYYWNWGIYRAAQYFNSCIDGVNGVRTADTEDAANQTIAQATIARAWNYYVGALGYGPVYKPNGDNSAKVLPYRTSSDVMSSMEDLSTLQEIYDRVLSDIHTHIKYLPDQTSSNTRFGKIQAYAFLSYYHLFTQNYDSVAIYADKALTMAAAQNGGMENLIYDMNQFSWADPAADDPDNITAQYNSSVNTAQGSDPITATYNREICLYRQCASGIGFNSNAYPSDEYVDLFDASTDLRRKYYIFEYLGYKTTVGGVTYEDPNHVLNIREWNVACTNGYTYPEILLMRAEGRARTGNTAGAISDLNYLRQFRHKTGTPELTAADLNSADKVIEEVINERRRELPLSSPKRFFDLKRLCLDAGKPWCKEQITHVLKGVSYTADVDSEYFVLPIRNAVLKWNPQWNIPMDESAWSNSK